MNNGGLIGTSGPVARWLDTFVCRQYADIFKKFGYDTLNDVRIILIMKFFVFVNAI